MTRHKFSKRLLLLSAALTMFMSQSALAGETVELNLEDAMQRAFNTNPAITIAGYERDSARASYNAARNSRWITISGNHITRRSGYDDDQLSAINKVIGNQIVVDGFQNVGKKIHNAHTNSLTATLPIYNGGKISGAIKQAKAGYLISEQGLQKAYNDMRSTVTFFYFDMLQVDDMQMLGREYVYRLDDDL